MSTSRYVQSVAVLMLFVGLGCSSAPTDVKTGPSEGKSEPASGDSGASWVQDAVGRIRVDTGDAGGMRGCTGTLTPEAKDYFTKVYTEAAKCGAAGGSPAKGSVTFHSTLEEGGGLSEFAVLDDKLGAPAVVECIQQKAMSVEFPKVDPKTPCVQLVHPLSFP